MVVDAQVVRPKPIALFSVQISPDLLSYFTRFKLAGAVHVRCCRACTALLLFLVLPFTLTFVTVVCRLAPLISIEPDLVATIPNWTGSSDRLNLTGPQSGLLLFIVVSIITRVKAIDSSQGTKLARNIKEDRSRLIRFGSTGERVALSKGNVVVDPGLRGSAAIGSVGRVEVRVLFIKEVCSDVICKGPEGEVDGLFCMKRHDHTRFLVL